MSWPWSQLGLPGPSGLSEVRHAYAEKLKTTHPEEDPEGFQRLHSAYQLASRMARQQKRKEGEQPPQSQPEPVRPPEPEPDREDFDFDQLLREGEGPSRPPEPEEQDFDFERLFAEGEAERAEARRRRGEERRRVERQQFQELPDLQFHQEEDRWQSTETILRTIEMMYNARAGAEEWQKFFQSPLFQQAKGSLDLIFGLEDFVSTKNLSQEARLALFLACGFDKGVSRPELRPLYQMLLPAWREQNREKNHERFLVVLGVLLGIAAPFVLVPLLDLGLIPALFISLSLVWIIWVVRKAIKTGNLERKARGQHMSRKQERRSVLLGTVCVAALIAALYWVRSGPELDLKKLLPTKDPREQVCRYIEKDFGVEVASLYKQYPLEDNSNIFYLESDTAKSFLAGPDGKRDGANTGYTTNLPEMMLFWELKVFAWAHDMSPVNALDQGLGREEVSGTFLITLPEEGGEEIIEDLGDLLEELRQEKWYKALPAQCELVLCSRELEKGRVVLIRVHPASEVYSVPQIRGLYEDGFAHSVFAQIIRELELDRNFMGDGEERYTLTNEGTARMKGEECFKLYGLDGNGAVALEYYVNTTGTAIYCVPGDFWKTGGKEEQISFYRPVDRNNASGPLGMVSLFYPWIRAD